MHCKVVTSPNDEAELTALLKYSRLAGSLATGSQPLKRMKKKELL
jgi:hypothetical protein